MPLEFALRKRIDLDRPPPRREGRWLRVPPLALPIAAYWLALVGAFCALRASAASPASLEPEGAPRDEEPALPALATFPDVAEVEGEREATAPQAPISLPQSVPLNPPAPRDEPEPVAHTVAHGEPRRSAHDEPNQVARGLAHDEPKPARESEPAPAAPATSAIPSCEAAAASAHETIDFGAARGAPDLTRDAFAAVLENGAYLRACAIPTNVSIEICAAVRGGNVVGVSVASEPHRPAVTACVRNAVSRLRFPQSPRLDITRTRFAATP